ncbi:hypothetical protein ACOJBO_21525 [Rhizobium beringeri]
MATAIGLVINIVPETSHIEAQFSPIAVCWSGINILVLAIASLICFEKPRRLFDAFKLDEAVHVDGVSGRIVSLALDKAVVAVPPETRFASADVTLSLEGFRPSKPN